MPEITIPYAPRAQFMPMHERTQRWAIVVAHRRAGKTVACINDLIRSALEIPRERPQLAYVAPYRVQAKETAWSYIKYYASTIPGMRFNESELSATFPNSAVLRIHGADNYERLRGIYLDDVVLDEVGDMDPRAWSEVIRPALADRQGRATFIGTPKGANHFRDLWEIAQSDPSWFKMRLPASETHIIAQEELDSARAQMSEDQYLAEFEASFEASVVGAFYGREMEAAKKAGRITAVPHQAEVSVHTWWDLGMDDATSIWFTQDVAREIHVIDYLEASGEGLPFYARKLQEKGYIYGTHNAPHDIAVKELGSGKSRLETAAELGIRFQIVPNIARQDGIDAARAFIPRCWFDAKRTEQGRLALVSYRKVWDDKRKVFQQQPLHDWASNGADAFRYLAVGHKTARAQVREPVRLVAGRGSEISAGWLGV